jgi:surfactin family lipopeptide synthetase A
MVPARFIVTDDLPRLASGKVDRRALAGRAQPDAEPSRAPPSTQTEKTLEPLWCRVLQLESADVSVGFFEAGGHSLLGLSLLAAINREFGVNMSLRDFFDSPSFADLASRIESLQWLAAEAWRPPKGESRFAEVEGTL